MSGAGVKVAWGWLSGGAERERVACEVREEMGFHIAMMEEELGAQGLEPGEARAQCRVRFGDAERFVREGERIKSGDTIMLQRINLGLLAVMVVAVAVVALRMSTAQQRSLAAIEKVSARLEEVGQVVAQRSDAPVVTGVVYITGDVPRPGPYQMPAFGLTLRRALISAGHNGQGPIRIYHMRGDHSEEVTMISAEEFSAGVKAGTRDFDLSANDRIVVGLKTGSPKTKEGPSLAAVEAEGQGGADPLVSQPDSTRRDSVFIVGVVEHPGEYTLSKGLTVRKLIVVAGGTGTRTTIKAVVTKGSNGQEMGITLSVKQLDDPAGNDIWLDKGDIVMIRPIEIPSAAAVSEPSDMIYIIGAVARPGPYAMPPDGITLKRAIIAAGGLRDGARVITVTHKNKDQEPLVIQAEQLDKPEFADPELQPNDTVTLKGAAPR